MKTTLTISIFGTKGVYSEDFDNFLDKIKRQLNVLLNALLKKKDIKQKQRLIFNVFSSSNSDGIISFQSNCESGCEIKYFLHNAKVQNIIRDNLEEIQMDGAKAEFFVLSDYQNVTLSKEELVKEKESKKEKVEA